MEGREIRAAEEEGLIPLRILHHWDLQVPIRVAVAEAVVAELGEAMLKGLPWGS